MSIRLSPNQPIDGRVCATFADLLERCDDADVIAVDMPIGLVEVGDRDADVSARRALGERRSSVFSAPPREALGATTFEEVQAICRRLDGRGLSKQAFALFPKIREVDAFVEDRRIFEAHPELSFAALHGAPAPHAKRTWAGMRHRLALLEAAGITIPRDLGSASDVAPDDVIDAAVLAWTARRIAAGEARSSPDEPSQRDASGRVIAIWT